MGVDTRWVLGGGNSGWWMGEGGEKRCVWGLVKAGGRANQAEAKVDTSDGNEMKEC